MPFLLERKGEKQHVTLKSALQFNMAFCHDVRCSMPITNDFTVLSDDEIIIFLLLCITGQMPLHLAAMNGHVSIAKLLCCFGANVNATVNIRIYFSFNLISLESEGTHSCLYFTGRQIRTYSIALYSRTPASCHVTFPSVSVRCTYRSRNILRLYSPSNGHGCRASSSCLIG